MNVIRKIWKFTWVTVSALVVLLLLLLFIISQLDINRYKGIIESEVSELTGRQLKIEGDLQIVYSLQPSLKLEKISFANAPWGRQEQMLSLELLQLKFELLPLLDERLVVNQLLLKGVDLSIETNADGKINWLLDIFTSDAPDSSEPFRLPFLPILQQVQFDAIHIYYVDVVSDIETDVVFGLQLSHSAIDEEVDFSVDGVVNQHAFNVTAETDFLNTVTAKNIAKQGIKLKLKADVLDVRVAVDGVIKNPLSAEGINISLMIEADDLDKTFKSATSQSIYQYLPDTGQQMSLSFSADLTDRENGYDISKLKLKLAGTDLTDTDNTDADLNDTDLTGDVSYVDQPGRPAVTAKLHSNKVNLNQFIAIQTGNTALREEKKPQPENKNAVIELPDVILPFDLLKLLDADIDYRVDYLQFDKLEPEKIKFNATLNDGKLQVKQFDLKLDGAPIQSSLLLDSSVEPPIVNVNLNIDNLQLGRILRSFEIQQLKSGALYSKVKLEARGNNFKSLLLSLKGESEIRLDDGSVKFQIEDKMHSADIDQLKLDFFGIKKPLKFNLKGDFGDDPLSLSGQIDSPFSVIDNEMVKLKLQLAALKIDFEADGSITRPLNIDSAELNIVLDTPESKESVLKISRLLAAVKPNKSIPDLPVKLQGLLTISPMDIRFEQMQFKAGKNDLSGTVIADLRGDRPSIDAKLESQLLDLNELAPQTIQESEEEKLKKQEEKSKKNKKSKKTRLFSTQPLPVLDGLDKLDLNLKYKLSKLISNKQSIDNIDLNLILKDSHLKIDPLSIDFSQGTIITQLELDSGKRTRFVLDVEIVKLRYDHLMAILGTREYAKGDLDSKVKLTSEGESISELMANLDGSVRLTTVDGTLNQGTLKLLSKDLVSMIPFTNTSDRQKINCGVVQFNINNGIAATHSMVVNTGAISALGTGDIDLTNESLSLYVAPRSKRTSLLRVAMVPVNITGPLNSPAIKPDVAGTTVSTTKTATNVSLIVATGGIWLLAEGLTNDLWDKFIDDTDYCARALAGDRIFPARITLYTEVEEDKKETDSRDDEDEFDN